MSWGSLPPDGTGETRFTNSYTWLTTLERAYYALPPEQHDEYEGYANPIGANFELMPAEVRLAVAQWLLGTIEELMGPAGAEFGWDRERDRAHLAELAAVLRQMATG